MESKELIVGQSTELATTSVADAMDEMGISAKELAIPKVLLMQNTSTFVGDERAMFGDLVNSLTADKLGDFKTPMEVLPLQSYRTWVVYGMESGQPEYMRTEPMTAANAELPWTDVEEGQPIRRDACLNFTVLSVKEIEGGEYFPYVISFRRTGFQAGKFIATHLVKQRVFKLPSYNKTILIGANKEKEGTNTYAVFNAKVGRAATENERKGCLMWIDLMKKTAVKVDESDLKAPEKVAPATVATHVVGESKEELY